MDYYRIFGTGRDKTGSEYPISIVAYERDSESTAPEDWYMQLSFAASRHGVSLVSGGKIESISSAEYDRELSTRQLKNKTRRAGTKAPEAA